MRLPSFNFPSINFTLPSLKFPNVSLFQTPADDLALVRSSPLRKASWATTRMGPLSRLSTPKRCWVEHRGDVVLVYDAMDVLASHEKALPTSTGVDPIAAGTLSELEVMENAYVASRVEELSTVKVALFVLSATSVQIRERKAVIKLRRLGEMTNVALSFEGPDQAVKWYGALQETALEPTKNLSDFDVVRHIGKGASGRVYTVEDRDSRERLALKVIEKRFANQSGEFYRHTLDERLVLQMARKHPFVLEMKYAFQNRKRLFLITELCQGGDLYDCIDGGCEPMDEVKAKHVAAELLLALEHVHKLGVVYRDLKLENILLDGEGHIRLADFGLSKVLNRESGCLKPTSTFCGTVEYIAPEMLRGEAYDIKLDLWSYGVLLYELVVGTTPFRSEHNPEDTYRRINSADIRYPRDMSRSLQTLLQQLLVRDPSGRIGAGTDGWKAVMAHEWFDGVDWSDLMTARNCESPLLQYCRTQKIAHNSATGYAKSPTGRREEKRQKQFAKLVADIDRDMKCVSVVNKSFQRPARRLWNRLRSPRKRRGRGNIAGYSFCDRTSTSMSHVGTAEGRLSVETRDCGSDDGEDLSAFGSIGEALSLATLSANVKVEGQYTCTAPISISRTSIDPVSMHTNG